MTSLFRRVGRLAGVVALAMLPLLTAVPRANAAGVVVNGGGSSFAKLEIDQWQADTAKAPYSLQVNYNAQGSTYGRTQYIQGSLDFGASDIPFQPGELPALNASSRKDFVYVPVSAGGLGLMYNLTDTGGSRITDLKLSRHAACRIFTETNDLFWDDPEIAATNPDLSLPHSLVLPVVRQDGSGTSYVFSQFCIVVAPDLWSTFVAKLGSVGDPEFRAGRPTSNWPPQFGHSDTGFGADGVAAIVGDPTGAGKITYNEAGFALKLGFPNAQLQTAAGNYLAPTSTNVNKALSYATKNDDGTFILTFSAPDNAAYFPSTYSYVISQTTGFDAGKGEVLARFLCYAVTKGQGSKSIPDGYAPLSAELVAIARDAIAKIPGAPPWDQCAVSTGGTTATTTTTTKPGATTTTKPGATTTTKPGTTTTTKAGGTTATTKARSTTATTKAGSTSATTRAPSAASSDSSVPGDASSSTVPCTTQPVSTTMPASTDPTASTAPDQTAAASTTTSTIDCVPLDPSGSATGVDDAAPSTDASGAVVAADGTGGTDAQGQPVVAQAQVPVKKAGPTVAAASKVGVDGQQVAWVLIEGAGVCALGVLLAGASKREGLRS